MFILDSLMIAGLRWVLDTTRTAAEAEMNDDSALRDQLLEAEMRRELGEIPDEEFRAIEEDLLARIREIRDRREGSGPLGFGAGPMEAAPGGRFEVDAELSGDFHEPGTPATSPPVAGSASLRRRAGMGKGPSFPMRGRRSAPRRADPRRTGRKTRSTRPTTKA